MNPVSKARTENRPSAERMPIRSHDTPVVPPMKRKRTLRVASSLYFCPRATFSPLPNPSQAAQLRNNLFHNCLGVTLCRKKNRLVAEYALRGLDQSIAVAAWQTQLTESLPEELRGSLPTIEEIEAELAGDLPPESPKQRGSHD